MKDSALNSLRDWLEDNVNIGTDICFDSEGKVKSEQALAALETLLGKGELPNSLSKTNRHDSMVCNKCEPQSAQHQRSDMVILHNGDVECAYCGDKKGNITRQVDDWIYPVDGKPETWPKHGQHVIVWDDRLNVYPFPLGCKGDDGEGRARMGDAIFFDGQVEWDKHVESGQAAMWGKDPEKYASMNQWHRWRGQGPCSFRKAVCWKPVPERPANIVSAALTSLV